MLKVLLLPLSTILIIGLCFKAEQKNNEGLYTALRLAVIKSLIIISVLAFSYTELVSAFNLLTPATASTFWLVIFLVAGIQNFQLKTFSIPQYKIFWKKIVLLQPLHCKYRLLSLVIFVIILCPLFFEAIYGTPNNLDSNNYHLLRIVAWMDNQNVEHFPTYHVQQLYHNVLSEYLVMQTMLLAGTDQFANLIQFVAMLGSLMAISLLAKNLGFNYQTQLFSSTLLLLLPIGIFESTTTQNDYLACFFFLSFLLFGYTVIKKKYSSDSIIFIALSLALGGFTKYPILLYAFPFCLYFGFRILTRYSYSAALKTLTITLVTFFLIFSPFFYRNFQLFGNVLGPPPESRLNNESIPSQKYSPAYTLSTFSKNIGIHLGLPNDNYNKQIDKAVTSFHTWLHVDPNDPALSNNPYYTRFVVHEDFMPNTLHLLVLLCILPFMFLEIEKRGSQSFSISRYRGFAVV